MHAGKVPKVWQVPPLSGMVRENAVCTVGADAIQLIAREPRYLLRHVTSLTALGQTWLPNIRSKLNAALINAR